MAKLAAVFSTYDRVNETYSIDAVYIGETDKSMYELRCEFTQAVLKNFRPAPTAEEFLNSVKVVAGIAFIQGDKFDAARRKWHREKSDLVADDQFMMWLDKTQGFEKVSHEEA